MSDSFFDGKIYILCGAMGTQLQKLGLNTGEAPDILNITKPDIITGIHRNYVRAGSDAVFSNTFGANRKKLAGSGYTPDEVIKAAMENLRAATKGTETLCGLDIGPIGELMEPTGSLSFEEAYDIFKEQIIAGKDYADFIAIETMTDLYEVKAAILAAKENSTLPVYCTMSFEKNGRTFTGCTPESAAAVIEGLGADAVGVNCSLGPEDLYDTVKKICATVRIPVAAKPNAGLPDPITGAYDVSPEEFARQAVKLYECGVSLFGGCCGTAPEYITELSRLLKSRTPVAWRTYNSQAMVCTPTRPVYIDTPKIIGERINPTGKKRFKEALKNNDIDYILSQATEQIAAGAEILDVNVGLPDIDEKDMMVRTIKAIQSITDVPLQIDSTNPEVLDAALRVYNGKAIVNSVKGEESSLEKILPIVKKYGAAVVGLTLDEDGIPKTVDKRFEIAERILNRALDLGIEERDVFIDCLTLTVSAEPEGAAQTLAAVRRVKDELGLKTVLGVSNISFGLPNRVLVNRNFLSLALANGLDLPIINPNVEDMTGAVRAYRLLMNIDKNASDYIAAYADKEDEKSAPSTAGAEPDIFTAIKNGLKNDGARITEELLKTVEPMEIINGMLIPALDKTGADFESGKIFLPQLIASAGVAQAAFDVIRNHLAASGDTAESRGTVVLATVKGDIHDIGKNIVKTLLDNYGYKVIDLGRDVEYEAVAKAAEESGAKLVGLSALMTTTLKSMEETIKLIHLRGLDCKIVVGGAVLTKDYAEKIGADYYAKDAKCTVDIAKEIYG